MGKLAAVAIFGSTGTVASLGGAYMFGAFGSSNLDIPVSLNDFKTKNGGDIVGSYFPGVSLSSEGEDWTTSSPDANFLGTDTSKGQGRLVVNWEKLKCSSNDAGSKLTGRIRWLWTFVNGDKGLVLYASAKASSEDSKLDADGVIYSLSKETDGWKVKQNKKPSSPSTKQITTSDFDSNFPSVADDFKSKLKVKEYWGFLDSTNKLNNLCKWEDSHNNKQEFEQAFKGSWTWTKGGNDGKKPFDWSKTGHSWLTTFYGTQTPTLDTLFTNFSGTWSEEYFVNKSSGVTVSQG